MGCWLILWRASPLQALNGYADGPVMSGNVTQTTMPGGGLLLAYMAPGFSNGKVCGTHASAEVAGFVLMKIRFKVLSPCLTLGPACF